MSMPDLVPTVQSRLVTFGVTEFAEDAPKSGSITFTLTHDLRRASSGVIIAAGTRTVHLVDGSGSIRLFTDMPDLMDDDGDKWAILVQKSWLPWPYPIRVPEGTTTISLAAISVYDWRA